MSASPRRAASSSDYLTPEEVAELVKVTPQTLANWRWRGTGPEFTKLSPGRGGRIRYPRKGVEQYLSGGMTAA